MHFPPYIPAWPDLQPFVAEIGLIVTAVAVLLTAFFVRKPNTAAGAVALVGLLVSLTALLILRPTGDQNHRFAPMLAADGVAMVWKVLLLIFTSGVVLLWFATTRHDTHQGDGPEFFLLLLTATLGMSLMASAANLLMIFLAIEMASLPSYVLAGFRKTHRVGAEASLKYVLFGAAASSVMVWGMSLLYGMCGTLNLYSMTNADGTRLAGIAERVFAQPEASALLLVAMLAIVVGLAFKISAVPFHLWCPDVFEGSSVDVTTFFSVASKGAALVLTLRIGLALSEAGNFAATTVTTTLAAVLAVLGALSCTVGNTAAYVQENLKRLLAYSSIAHAGYMLCVVAMIVRRGIDSSTFAASASQALLFYLAVYLFMNLGAFSVVAVVNGQTGGETIADLRGLGRRSPKLAMSMAICCFSLIGVPPLAGFTAKFNVMQTLGSNGGWWWVLVGVIALNTLLSIYYYARILRAMYLEDDGAAALPSSPLGTALAMTSGVALVALFVGSNGLNRWTASHAALRSAAMQRAPSTHPTSALAAAESSQADDHSR